MTSAKEDSIKTSPAKRENLWKQDVIIGVVSALFLGIIVWMADPNSSMESKSPEAGSSSKNSYYNLLVQGFSEGHLYLKRDAPPALARLANPYDPTANRPYITDVGDMSYYHGHLYLYFGVTPALVLLWPYHALTGDYLSDRSAVAIFFAAGFAVAVALMCAVRRRYFAEVNIWMLIASMLTFGLVLNSKHDEDFNHIPITSGFAFTMLALAAIWCALHSFQKRRVFWMLLASLAYGLAVGSRPSLLFGVLVLLSPVARAWGEAAGPRERWRTGPLFAAAVGPVMLAGFGLMLYNDLRFGNPFDFGFRYQMTAAYEPITGIQFSPGYFWFNFRYYFLEPFGWSGHFPFLQSVQLPPAPAGFYPGVTDACGGIFTNHPLVLFAFAAPLAWASRPATASPLRWFVAAVFWLFAACAVTLCLFINAALRFEMDFLPCLLLLSVIGFLSLARVAWHSRHYVKLAYWGWCLLIGYSVAFCALSNIESHARADCATGKSFYYDGRLNDALAQYQKAESLWPDCPDAHYGFANILMKTGHWDDAIAEYQKVLAIQPDYAMADNNLGYTLIQSGRPGEAIVYFQRALKFEQDFKDRAYVWYYLGYANQLDGKTAEAADDYQKALALWPDCVEAHRAMGNILVGRGDMPGGIAEYQKALALRPDDTEANNNLGFTLIRLGRVGEAIVCFQKALEFEPGDPARARAYYNLGYACQLDGKISSAADNYQKALELQPQFLPALISLAWIQATWPDVSLRHGSQAVVLMEKANQLSGGNNPGVLRTLAAAYAEAGRFDDAIATAQKAIALAQQNGDTNLVKQNEEPLGFYLKHQPYHQGQTSEGH